MGSRAGAAQARPNSHLTPLTQSATLARTDQQERTVMQLTTAQAATALGIAEQTIRDHVIAGRLPATRATFRRFYRIDADDLRRFAETYTYTLDEAYLYSLALAQAK